MAYRGSIIDLLLRQPKQTLKDVFRSTPRTGVELKQALIDLPQSVREVGKQLAPFNPSYAYTKFMKDQSKAIGKEVEKKTGSKTAGSVAQSVVETPGQIASGMYSGATHYLAPRALSEEQRQEIEPETILGQVGRAYGSLKGFSAGPGRAYYGPLEAPVEQGVARMLGPKAGSIAKALLPGLAAEATSSLPVAALRSLVGQKQFIGKGKTPVGIPFTGIQVGELPIGGTYPEEVVSGVTARAAFSTLGKAGQKYQEVTGKMKGEGLPSLKGQEGFIRIPGLGGAEQAKTDLQRAGEETAKQDVLDTLRQQQEAMGKRRRFERTGDEQAYLLQQAQRAQMPTEQQKILPPEPTALKAMSPEEQAIYRAKRKEALEMGITPTVETTREKAQTIMPKTAGVEAPRTTMVDKISTASNNSFENRPKDVPDFEIQKAITDITLKLQQKQELPEVRITQDTEGGVSILSNANYLEAARRMKIDNYPIKDMTGQSGAANLFAKVGGEARPAHQELLEQAINSKNWTDAKQILDNIPLGDPYKQPMESLFRSKVESHVKGEQAMDSLIARMSKADQVQRDAKMQPEIVVKDDGSMKVEGVAKGPDLEDLDFEQQMDILSQAGITPKAEGETDIKAELASQQERAVAEARAGKGGLKNMSPDIQDSFRTWVNARQASRVEGYAKKLEFQNLDRLGFKGVQEFQKGIDRPEFEPLKNYFDDKYKEASKAGFDMQYRHNYITQLWSDPADQVREVFDRTLNLRPGFTLERVFQNYQEGIEAGLTPKYKNISDIAGWYEGRVNKAIADKDFFSYLVKQRLIVPSSRAPMGWKVIDEGLFPRIKIKGEDVEFSGRYAAPEELARLTNNYLRGGEEHLAAIANYASSLKNIVLSAGVPNTALNFHGANILARNTMVSKNPIEGWAKGVYYMARPSAAKAFFQENLKDAEFAARHGLKVSTEDFEINELPDVKGTNLFARGFNKIVDFNQEHFEKQLFQQTIPALKLKYWSDVYKDFKASGMEDTEAARKSADVANDIFGGINWQQEGRDNNIQNLLRATILAPDWSETNFVRIPKGMFESVKPKNWTNAEYKPYRQIIQNTALMYAGASLLNYLRTKKWLWQNDPGHTFEIDTGVTDSKGDKIYARPFGTAADFVRIPYDVALSIYKGDFDSIARVIRNRLSIPFGVVASLLFNVDYRGKPILGTDAYGRPLPISQQVAGLASAASRLYTPPVVGAGIDFAAGRISPEEFAARSLEAPARFVSPLSEAYNFKRDAARKKQQKELMGQIGEQGILGTMGQGIKEALPGLFGGQEETKGMFAKQVDIAGQTNAAKVEYLYSKLEGKSPEEQKAMMKELEDAGMLTDGFVEDMDRYELRKQGVKVYSKKAEEQVIEVQKDVQGMPPPARRQYIDKTFLDGRIDTKAYVKLTRPESRVNQVLDQYDINIYPSFSKIGYEKAPGDITEDQFNFLVYKELEKLESEEAILTLPVEGGDLEKTLREYYTDLRKQARDNVMQQFNLQYPEPQSMGNMLPMMGMT